MIYARTHHDPANAPGLIRSATENYDHLNADEFFPLVEEEADAIHDNLKTAYDMGAAARSHTPINIR